MGRGGRDACGVLGPLKPCESWWSRTSGRYASFIRQGLEEEGYAVDVASDGAAAVDLALGGTAYDLVILDVMLPEAGRVCGPANTTRRARDRAGPHAAIGDVSVRAWLSHMYRRRLQPEFLPVGRRPDRHPRAHDRPRRRWRGFEVRNLIEFCRTLEAKGIKLTRPYSKSGSTRRRRSSPIHGVYSVD